jgi:hypothetical protein
LEAEQIWPVRWGQKRRLEFIEFRLLWEGRVNRSDLMDFFGISMPQASLDFTKYRELAPANAVYDSTEKTYVAGSPFSPALIQNSADEYLNRILAVESGHLEPNSTFLGWRPTTAIVQGPARTANTLTLRTMLQAIRERRTVEITYQSMNAPVPAARKVSPHALAFDGFRWHARAFCHRRQAYRDFVLARILGIAIENVFETDPVGDLEWRTFVEAVVVPAPHLSVSQRKAIELDYGMADGRLVLQVREALLFYHLGHLGLLDEPEKPTVRDQIVLSNRAELESFFKKHATEPR